jgi:hypothetical protein
LSFLTIPGPKFAVKRDNTTEPLALMQSRYLWHLTPVIGVIGFVILHVLATFYYPGGSSFHPHAEGYSWLHNYWSNLLSETAVIFLTFSLGLFWLAFSDEVREIGPLRWVIQISGILSMLITIILVRGPHNMLVNVASAFGLIATIGTTLGARKLDWTPLYWMGIVNICLIIVNNAFYYVPTLQVALPLLQKFTFLSYLTWICLLNLALYKKIHHYQFE